MSGVRSMGAPGRMSYGAGRYGTLGNRGIYRAGVGTVGSPRRLSHWRRIGLRRQPTWLFTVVVAIMAAAIGRGGAQAQASHWRPRGRTTAATVMPTTVTMSASSGGPIGAG